MPLRHVPGMPMAYARMMEEFQVSVSNFERLYAMQRRNMVALAEANKISLEVMQAFARRQAQIMEQTTAMFTDAASGLLHARNPAVLAQRQLTVAHDAFRLAQTELKAFLQLATDARADAWQLWTADKTQPAEGGAENVEPDVSLPQPLAASSTGDDATASLVPAVEASPISLPAPAAPPPAPAKVRRPAPRRKTVA